MRFRLICMFAFITIISSFLFSMDMSVAEQEATEAETAKFNFCDLPFTKRSLFYKFDKIYIFFSSIPREDDNPSVSWPDVFNEDVFINRTENMVRKLYDPCIKKEDGSIKPIISVKSFSNDMLNKQNIIIFINLKYPDGYIKDPDVRSDIALLTTQVFRSDLEPVDFFWMAYKAKSFVINVEGRSSVDVARQLDRVLQGVGPTQVEDMREFQ